MKILWVVQPLLILFYSCAVYGETKCPPTELSTRAVSRLRQVILCGYDKLSRPVKNVNTTVTVSIAVSLLNVEFSWGEKMSVEGLFRLWWKDEYLSWNPADYDGVTYFRSDSKEIWLPDFTINLLEDNGVEELPIKTCSVSETGSVNCLEKIKIATTCYRNVRRWPFDEHSCSFSLSSYMYFQHELNITTRGRTFEVNERPAYSCSKLFQIKAANNNRAWDLTSFAVARKDLNYTFAPDVPTLFYPRLNFTFTLRRHPGVLQAATVLPAGVLLTVMLSSFWMGTMTTCRIFICGFAIYSCGFFSIYLVYLLPAGGSNVPTIIILFRDCMALSGFALLTALVVKALHSKGQNQEKPPPILLSITDWVESNIVGRIFCLVNTPAPKDDEAAIIEDNSKPNLWEPIANLLDRLAFISALIVTIVLVLGYLP